MENTKSKQLKEKELQQVCNELKMQLDKAHQQIQRISIGNTLQRLDFLLRVLDHADLYDKDFIKYCVTDIQEALVIKEQEESCPKSAEV